MNPSHACADSGIRGGGSRPDGQKTVWTTLFYLFLLFLVLSVFYNLQKGSNGFITRKSILFQGSRGDPTLSGGGGPTFPKGGGCPISSGWNSFANLYTKTHITCDLQKNVFPLRRFFLIPKTHVVVEV